MARSILTGTRIRERRILEGVKQAELARAVGISPAYLNLIEHNRRRIGGKLLVDLARELSVDVPKLTQGAEIPLLEGLQSAANQATKQADKDDPTPEVPRVEEFAGRFPGWSALIVAQHDHITHLERRIEALNDRISHDPELSDALHEVLSTATAIRSTAGILNAGDPIDPEWQTRFHRNLYEESQRLADGSQSLVRYLDTIGRVQESLSTPLEEAQAWLATQDYAIETNADPLHVTPPDGNQNDGNQNEGDVAQVVDGLSSSAARDLAARWRAQAQADNDAMPLEMVDAILVQHGPDPAALAAVAQVPLAIAMRRLAALPTASHRPPIGLARCDGSGTLVFRKPLDGFALPRFGAGCPQWPLYQALLQPTVPLRRIFSLEGQSNRRFLAHAICAPSGVQSFDKSMSVEATMMFVPLEQAGPRGGAFPQIHEQQTLDIGEVCRICGHMGCGEAHDLE